MPAFAAQRDAAARKAVIAYLRTLGAQVLQPVNEAQAARLMRAGKRRATLKEHGDHHGA